MFRASFHRALAGATAVLAAGALTTASASEAFPGCDRDASTRVVDGAIADTVPYYIWVQQVSDTETRVCAGNHPADFAVVVRASLTVDPPAVGAANEDEQCPLELFSQAAANDSVSVRVAVAATMVTRLCVRVNGQEATFTVNAPVAGVEVWRDSSPALGNVACAQEYLAWRAAGGGTASQEFADYHACLTTPERLV